MSRRGMGCFEVCIMEGALACDRVQGSIPWPSVF